MAPLTPTWERPSHPDIQDVIINDREFTSKSLSRVSLPPFGFFAKMAFPPCTRAEEPTYATVQIGQDKHLNLNSDLLYINHSCEPSLIFDTSNLNIIAGPNGLRAGEELTFFYPSTEWDMAQSFDCLCGKPTCRGRIGGAKNMTQAQLEGTWLNGHVRELLLEQQQQKKKETTAVAQPLNKGIIPAATDGWLKLSENDTAKPASASALDSAAAAAAAAATTDDATAQALRDALKHAEKVVEAARIALQSYMESSSPAACAAAHAYAEAGTDRTGADASGLVADAKQLGVVSGATRRGPTSRELSGEMGGDTAVN